MRIFGVNFFYLYREASMMTIYVEKTQLKKIEKNRWTVATKSTKSQSLIFDQC